MRKSKRTFIGLILFVIFFCACGGGESHVKGNVPDKKDFDNILKKDMESYFKSKTGKPDITVKYELLRNGPTQSGTSYPKFYIWVSITDDDNNTEEGAIRCAAIDKLKFEVTHYLTKDNIKGDPEEIKKVFPKEVCEIIMDKVNK